MSEKTNREWNETFSSAQARFPFGPVNNLAAVFSDEQVLHNKMVVEMEHEKVGTIKQVKAKLIFICCFVILCLLMMRSGAGASVLLIQ
jgi:crotonobetainyl-CoA:carnitine CoA-transferase CaiB-like acyl-CoA transferase